MSGKSPPTKNLSRRYFLKVSGSAAAMVSTNRVGKAFQQESEKKIRIGVVGGNFGTKFYWHEHPNCVVTGVTDLRPERRKLLSKTYQCDSVYDSLEEMISTARDIDAIALFSGAPDHAKHAQMCMERGWHILSAVPACLTLREAALLKETKERTGMTYMMGETSYYRQECILARSLYRNGAFGRLFYSESEYYHDRGDLNNLVENKNSRFYEPDASYSWRWGFPPMHYPTHSTGLLIGVTKERIEKVSCLGWGTQDHPYLTDNTYSNPYWNESALMLTDGGNIHRCNVFWLCAAHGERAQWFGDKATLYMAKGHIHDTKLNYRTGQASEDMFDLMVQEDGKVEVPDYWKSDMLPEKMRHNSGHGGSHTFISAEFVNALIEGREPEVDVYEALAMTVPGIIAHQSALRGGEQLSVPQYRRPRT